ncbi:hypothetical protein GWI33_012227 [Rhynchophorus ferrugineus]|uniref:Uncharacterized protein n=1 Tax=Rhynchophorus ferrugineus TaxID=354439 RepID=A0A834IAG3_RHYFE|nr:hypothetical protein GWI33_012227 [Rhynchophorus ferrugineus]
MAFIWQYIKQFFNRGNNNILEFKPDMLVPEILVDSFALDNEQPEPEEQPEKKVKAPKEEKFDLNHPDETLLNDSDFWFMERLPTTQKNFPMTQDIMRPLGNMNNFTRNY